MEIEEREKGPAYRQGWEVDWLKKGKFTRFGITRYRGFYIAKCVYGIFLNLQIAFRLTKPCIHILS